MIRIRSCVTATVSVVLWAAASYAQAQVLTLQQAEARALQQPELVAEDAAISQAQARVDAARARYYPNLSFAAGGTVSSGGQLVRIDQGGRSYYVRGSQAITGSQAFVPSVRYEAGLSLQGTLYDFGRTRAAVAAARSATHAARAERAATRAELLRDVRSAYLDWLAAYQLEQHADAALQRANTRVQNTADRIASGARPPADLTVAHYSEAAARLDLSHAHDRLDSARYTLERVMGEPVDDAAQPDPSVLTSPAAPSSELARHQLAILESQERAAQQTAAAATHVHAPVLSGELQSGVVGQYDKVFPSYRVGLSLALPLWDGGQSRATAAEALAKAKEIEARIRALRVEQQAAAAQTETATRHAVEQVAATTAMVRYAKEQRDQAQERYRLGSGTLEDVTDAEARLADAESRLLQARVDHARAVMRLLAPAP